MARSALAQATNFAHLLRFGRGESAQPAPVTALESPLAAMAAEDDDDDDKDDKDDKKARRAKSKEGDEDDDKDDKDDKKSKRARSKSKSAEDDDDEEQARAEHDDAISTRAIRLQERARCAAIFATAAAARRPDMAAYFAFGTELSREAAIDALQAIVNGEPVKPVAEAPPPARRASLTERMAQEPRYEVAPEVEKPAQTGPEAFAAAVIAADKKRRGQA
jgi:hypothetical protein